MLLLTGLILLAQLFSYLQKRQTIVGYATLFPQRKALGISWYRILHTALERTPPDTLLTDIHKFHLPAGAEAGVLNLPGNASRIVPVGLIAVSQPSKAFSALAYALNAYLLRNSATTTDYAVLEAIAERHNQSRANEIRPLLSAPLALGVLGALALTGYLSYTASPEAPAVFWRRLPAAVHYLVLPLIAGVGLRQLLRNAFYQKAQEENAIRRTAFLTFLQTELLPFLNPAPDGTMRGLQNQLQRFGQDFTANLDRLDGLLTRNYDALLAQTALLDALKNADLVALSGANVSILQELQKSTGQLAGFNAYLSQVESLVQTLQQGVAQMNAFVARTETLEDLAGRALAATAENRQLLAFLQNHYQELDKSRQLLADGVVDVNRTLQGALDELQRFTQEKIDRIRAMETYEAERLSGAEAAEQQRLLRQTLEDIRLLLARQKP